MALTQEQLSRITKELKRVYEGLLEDIRNEQDASGNTQIAELLGRVPADSGDISVADALVDLNVELIDRHVQGLRDVEAARQRLAEGNFGICADCETNIGFERMLAYPTARRCLPCQETREKMFAHKATPRL
ncbi:MAG: conjugal transfer protein TraR [Betaproteobacteria bacterium SG8_40]|nr:MAG: conjugal transfer protein TraR [Betaproteobacteria bacterium SG8_40]